MNKRILHSFLFAISTTIFALAGVHSAGAISSDPKMFISGDNTFYAYVKAGEKISASFSKSGQVEPLGLTAEAVTVTLDGPSLPQQKCTIDKTVAVGGGCGFKDVVAPQTGVYRIDFKLPATATLYQQVSPTVRWNRNMFSWNVTVSEGAVAKAGRVWSEQYAIRQPIQPEYATDLLYYYMSENGYLYKATYKGYNGQISTLAADAFGIRTNNTCKSAYQSITVDDAKMSPSFGQCGGSYKLFFEQPSGDLPELAKRWDDKQEWVRPSINRPIVGGLKFNSDASTDIQAGKIFYTLKNYVGQYEIKIDTNNDGNYDATEDIKITHRLDKISNDTQEIKFDGIDGDGQPIPKSQTIGIKINIAKIAEIHLVNADVEGRAGGLELVRLSGDNAPTFGMCWDDTKLESLTSTALATDKPDGRSCPSSQGGVHGWRYGTGAWGDMRYIDDWAYAAAKVDGTAEIHYPEAQMTAAATTPERRNIGLIIAGVTGILAMIGVFVAVRIWRHHRALKKYQPPQPPKFTP